MTKIATGVVLAALITATATPALAVSNRPATTASDAATLAATVPVTYAATSTGGSSAAPSATSDTTVSDPTLYSGLLSYFKADLNYQGAVYQAFVDAGLSTTALSQAYSKLDAATSSLITYLQTKVTSA